MPSEARRLAARAAAASGARRRPNGIAPSEYSIWNGILGVWTNEASDVRPAPDAVRVDQRRVQRQVDSAELQAQRSRTRDAEFRRELLALKISMHGLQDISRQAGD